MNQCDGCRRGIPVKDGMHDLTGTVGSYPDEKMACTAYLYEKQPEPIHTWETEGGRC